MEPRGMSPPGNAVAQAAWATALFALALALANVGLPGYSHWTHPVALRGATGLPWAFAFNLFGFVLPGVLLLWVGQRMRAAQSAAAWPARIGIVLAQLSALAFAAQGLLPLDPDGMDAIASRLHALAWMLWWIAFVPGAVLLAIGARRGTGFALGCLLAATLVPLLALFAPIGLWVGFAQRLVFGLWFGWWLLAARALTCASTSAPGSSTTAGT